MGLLRIVEQGFVPVLPTRQFRRCHIQAGRVRIVTGQS